MNPMHETNRKKWNAIAQGAYRERIDSYGRWRRVLEDPSVGLEGPVLGFVRKYVGEDLTGKQVCALASGDNCAVFALWGMGAEVTSVDISEAQLDVAGERAAELGISGIRFLRSDITDVPDLADDTFDFVICTNGVHVWMTDLAAHFGEACRILKPGGIFICYDIHPFMRPFDDSKKQIEPMKSYFDTGSTGLILDPKIDETVGLASEISLEEREQKGYVSMFACAWTVSELIGAMLKSGLELVDLSEDSTDDARFWGWRNPDPEMCDWHKNPYAALPVWLTLVGKKAYL